MGYPGVAWFRREDCLTLINRRHPGSGIMGTDNNGVDSRGVSTRSHEHKTGNHRLAGREAAAPAGPGAKGPGGERPGEIFFHAAATGQGTVRAACGESA